MKFFRFLPLLILLAACAPASPAAPTQVAATSAPVTVEAPTFTPIPTLTSTPVPTPTPLVQLGNDGKSVAYDFTAHLCEATWMTGTRSGLPCPGDVNNPSSGYVGLLSGSDQGLDPNLAMVLMFPANQVTGGGGLFGRFPPFQVGPNDEFRATFACRSGYNCDVEFGLGYYDGNNKFYELFQAVRYRQGEPPINFVWSLNGLSGQTVSLVPLIRSSYQSDINAAWGLMIAPRILR